jgi:hypothetical protein
MLTQATHILSDGMWRNRRCFIIGGGPSLRTFDFRLIEEDLSIGVNMAFRFNPTITYIADAQLLRELEQDPTCEWFRANTIKLVRNDISDDPELTLLGCLGIRVQFVEGTSWSSSLTDGLALANNSGLIALQIADILGADPIYLLGFDMWESPDDGEHNWHGYYKEKQLPEKKHSTYYSFIETWRRVVPQRVVHKTYNVGLESRLMVFRRISIEVLKAQLGKG